MKATLYHRSKHLAADEIISCEAACPACGDASPRGAAGVVQRGPDVALLCCARCGACSASHMPTQAVLDAYYRDYYHDTGDRITFAEVDGFARNLLSPIDITALPARVRVLDFGGGDGTLAIAVARRLLADRADRMVSITLVDYEPPRATDDARITFDHRPRLEQVEGAFDLVIASAILEHIPALRETVTRLFSHLAPGGWFYARTPYVAPLKRLLPGLDITYPAHVHDLGAPFWNRLPATFGLPLRIVASRPSMIESDLRTQPRRTVLAWLMKLPARVELALCKGPRTPVWRLVGGWEVVMRREGGD